MKAFFIVVVALLALSGCTKEYSFEGTRPAANTNPLADTAFITDSTDFYDISLEGKRIVHVIGRHQIALSGSSGDSAGSKTLSYDFYSDTSSYPDFELHKGMLKKTLADSTFLLFNQKEIKDLLPGAYSYTKDPNLSNGVFFLLRDSAGISWSTMSGSADQTGSYFQIEKQFNFDKNFGTTGISHSIHIVCRFECFVYDENGRKQKISNGRLGLTLWI